jgi:hypothetical protein
MPSTGPILLSSQSRPPNDQTMLQDVPVKIMQLPPGHRLPRSEEEWPTESRAKRHRERCPALFSSRLASTTFCMDWRDWIVSPASGHHKTWLPTYHTMSPVHATSSMLRVGLANRRDLRLNTTKAWSKNLADPSIRR